MTSYTLLFPVCNEEKNLPRMFKMLESMNPKADHVIFMESGSTDNSLEMLALYADTHPNVDAYNCEKESKYTFYDIAFARQCLLNIARKLDADFTFYMDCDTEPKDLNFLEKLSNVLLVHNNFDMIGCSYRFKKYKKRLPRNDEPYVKLGNLPLYQTVVVPFGCVCISRRIIQNPQINFFPLFINKHDGSIFNEDISYCILCIRLGYNLLLENTIKVIHHQDFSIKREWRLE